MIPRMKAFLLSLLVVLSGVRIGADERPRYNVLFLIADDLTATALSCYGNQVCVTPNIDRLASEGMRFTRAYCNATYCGPSRASFLSGYYPDATGVKGYNNPRPQIGDRATLPQHFKNHGAYAARVGKLYHMGVPGGVEDHGGDPSEERYNGADDALSWTERFNTPGPEWRAPGDGETLEGNPDGTKPVVGGNTFVVVEADGDDLVHCDGKTAKKASELIAVHQAERFWIGAGFVRPHVPFVAPRPYFEAFKPYEKLALPPKRPGDWDDIPEPGINYKTSENMKMDERRQKKALGGYYAAVTYLDAQVGVVLDALERSGKKEETIIVFTSDHGYHLGEHDFWAKVSLRDESSGVPLIIRVPGKKPAVCESLVELIDLYPTLSALCGLPAQERLQGKDLSPLFDDPSRSVRDAAFSVAPMRNGFLLRTKDHAFIQYGEDAAKGIELFDSKTDPSQFHNLAGDPAFAGTVADFRERMSAKLAEVRKNDL